MNEQTSKRSALLEPVFFEDNAAINPAEYFQNTVLRPVLKFQNELLCRVAIDAVKTLNPAFNQQAERKQKQFITTALTSNAALRNTLLGIVIGMFDEEQLIKFLADRKELSKRIQLMLQVRVLEQYQKFL
jgi:hypothetical protein